MRSLVLILILASTASAAPKPPKAHMECLSGNTVVKSGAAVKLETELWCTIHVDSLGGYKATSMTGNMTINLAKTTTGIAPLARFGPLDDTQDGVVFQLKAPWVPDKDYRTCEAFTINATLDDAEHPGMDQTVWKMTYKVAASCPKPKAVAGALSCSYKAQDGTIFKWPGNGAKVKPRMESAFSCVINAGKAESGVKYLVSLGITGKEARRGAFNTLEDGKQFFEATFEAGEFESCSNFGVAGDVKANGATLWSGKLAVKQDCPD